MGPDQLNDHLRWTATHDPLTGSLNRAGLDNALVRVINSVRDSAGQLMLSYADIDELGSINDRYGHMVGDEILKATAEALKVAYGSESIVGRIGGNEFAIITQGVSKRDLGQRANTARRPTFIGEHIPDSTETLPVTLSVGIAVFPENGTSSEELLRSADIAMGRAKRAGGNRVVWA